MPGIIDAKGRLFGKINVVDFLIIMIFLVITPVFFHVYKIMNRMPTRIQSEWITVQAVTFTLPEIAELFTPEDVATDIFGTIDSKLIRVVKKTYDESERYKKAMVDAQSQFRIPVFLEFELSCTEGDKGGLWYFRRRALSLGLNRTFLFNSLKYRIDCYPIKIEK